MMVLSQYTRFIGSSLSRSIAAPYQTRLLSVKALTWCSPGPKPNDSSDSSSKNKELLVKLPTSVCVSCNDDGSNDSFKFGIIAAMDKNRLLGLDKELPWSLPEDRTHFNNITRNKVLIIGKNCFHETSDFSHLFHLRHVIVVSTTLKQEDLKCIALENVDLARSFEEALVLGENLALNHVSEQQNGELEIDCWVGGGQLIYEKAIRHPNAYELILTTVHTEVEVDFSSGKEVSFFPAKYRWDNAFKEDLASKRESVDKESGLAYTFSFYRR